MMWNKAQKFAMYNRTDLERPRRDEDDDVKSMENEYTPRTRARQCAQA